MANDHSGSALVAPTLALFPAPLRSACDAAGIQVRVLAKGEKYLSASRELSALRIDVDAWPAPPAGLFVVAERTLYVKKVSPLTVAHEYGHAIDCALGGGTYLSSRSPEIRAAFAGASRFVTPYAATSLDEYFAECMRAYVGVNDRAAAASWPAVSRERLAKIDPTMFEIIERLAGGGAA